LRYHGTGKSRAWLGPLYRALSPRWNLINSYKPANRVYQNLRLRLQPSQNAIKSKLIFNAKNGGRSDLSLKQQRLADRGTFVDTVLYIGLQSLNVSLTSQDEPLAIEPNSPVLKPSDAAPLTRLTF
jgi:hypothetical protein